MVESHHKLLTDIALAPEVWMRSLATLGSADGEIPNEQPGISHRNIARLYISDKSSVLWQSEIGFCGKANISAAASQTPNLCCDHFQGVEEAKASVYQ